MYQFQVLCDVSDGHFYQVRVLLLLLYLNLEVVPFVLNNRPSEDLIGEEQNFIQLEI